MGPQGSLQRRLLSVMNRLQFRTQRGQLLGTCAAGALLQKYGSRQCYRREREEQEAHIELILGN